ncbi:MAG: zinc-ribbon domain-containing protein, partial [Arenibacter sp.]|nr:zinc-ribbon domain-containing protein [Arenibacter sp.]
TVIMIIGYGVIAVPTGIVSAEYASGISKNAKKNPGRACPECGTEIMRVDAQYCRECGHRLNDED